MIALVSGGVLQDCGFAQVTRSALPFPPSTHAQMTVWVDPGICSPQHPIRGGHRSGMDGRHESSVSF